jgi:hypothetical protein
LEERSSLPAEYRDPPAAAERGGDMTGATTSFFIRFFFITRVRDFVDAILHDDRRPSD